MEDDVTWSRRAAAIAAAASLAVPLSAAAPAQAAPGPWSDPVTVLRSDAGFQGNLDWRLQVATGDGGQVLVSTATQIDDDAEGQLAYRATGSAPYARTRPSQPGDDVDPAHLARRSDGSIVAVWTETANVVSQPTVRTATLSRPGRWSAARTLGMGSAAGIDVDGRDTVHVAWTTTSGLVRVSTKRYGRAWSTPAQLGRGQVHSIDAARDGSAVIGYSDSARSCSTGTHPDRFLVRTLSASNGRWSGATTIHSSCTTGAGVARDVAAGPGGKVVAVVASAGGTYSFTAPSAGRAFGPKTRVRAGARQVAVEVGGDGVTTLAVVHRDGSAATTTQARGRTSWGAHAVLAGRSAAVQGIDLAVTDAGDAVVAWKAGAGTGRHRVSITARTKARGTSAWTTPRVLSTKAVTEGDAATIRGWVDRGDGGSTAAAWYEPDPATGASPGDLVVRVSSFG
jgi:hypothetical protein